MIQQELMIRSSLDGSMQPSLYYRAAGAHRPLLVGLHTWSYDRFNQIDMVPYAKELDFNLLLPEFRGPNLTTNPNCTQACASTFAMQDIVDAIDYVLEHEDIDGENIFLLGGSGGGHMALMMCGFCPERFKAVASFVPITDLEKWTQQNLSYREHVLACCSQSKEEMMRRSPVFYAEKIAKANVKIFHGKYDDSVPVTHSMEMYQKIYDCSPEARVFLDLFDGGHEIDLPAGMRWFVSQYEKQNHARATG